MRPTARGCVHPGAFVGAIYIRLGFVAIADLWEVKGSRLLRETYKRFVRVHPL
jgi:hypothetical protein